MTIPMLVVIAPIAIAGLAIAYDRWPRTGEALYNHRLGKLRADMRARGLSPQQQIEELAFRRAWAVLRRRCSDRVLKDPGCLIQNEVSRIAVEVSKSIVDKDIARRFLKVARDTPFTEVLYDDANRAVLADARRMAKRIAKKPRTITEDDIAAVTTIR